MIERDDATAPTLAVSRDDVDSAGAETLPASPTAPGASIPVDASALATVPAATYTILGEHGRGGLGRILRARDERTGRVVAIKEILDGNVDAAARFVREALVTANLQHPAIVPVYEVGRWPSGQPFYAMKLVAGRTLSAAITDARDLAARLALLPHVAAVADALAYAHEAGVIHRDLKPSNVLVGAFGETVVIDWGLAKRTLGDDDHELPLPAIASSETVSGSVMGTPAYMPPEQAIGEAVDARADVYAIGAMLYHLLAGAPPYAESTNAGEIITRVRTGKPPAPIASLVPDVAPDLAAIVTKAMARNASHRYADAKELARDLRAFTTGGLVGAHHYTTRQRIARWVRRHRAPVVVAALALVALGAFGTYSVIRIVRERDRAQDAQAESTARLAASYEDRARVELLGGHPQRALPFVVEALRLGRDTPTTRFLAARAAEPLAAIASVLPAPEVHAALFHADTHDLIVVTRGDVVRWDPERDREVWRRSIQAGVVIDGASGTHLAASVDGGLAMLDPSDGRVIAHLEAPGGGLADALEIDEERHSITAVYNDGRIIVWDYDRGAVSIVLHHEPDSAGDVSRSPDGRRLAIGAYNSSTPAPARLVDLATGAQIAELCPTKCRSPHYNSDGTITLYVLGAPGDQHGMLALDDGDGHRRWEVTTDGGIFDLATLPDALCVGTTSGHVMCVARADGHAIWEAALPDPITSMMPIGTDRVSVVEQHGTDHVFDVHSGAELASYATGGTALWVGSSADGKLLAMATLDPWIAVARVGAPPSTPIAPSDARVRRVAFAPDGRRAITTSDDGTVASWNVATGALERRFAGHKAGVGGLVLDAAGARALTGSRDGTAALWDVATGARLRSFDHGAPVRVAWFSPDETRVLTGGLDGAVRQWDVATGRSLGPALAMPVELLSARWSPDGRRIAAIDDDGEVRVWDADSGRVVRQLDAVGHGIAGTDLAFSPDGRWLVLARDHMHPAMLALDGGADRPLRGVDYPLRVFAVVFDHAGDRVALASTDDRVHIWDTATGALVTSLDFAGEQLGIDWSADDRVFAAGGVDRLVHVFDAASGVELSARTAPDQVYVTRFSPRGDTLAVLTLSSGLFWRIPSYAGSVDDLARLSRCRAGWRLAEQGLLPAPVETRACR